MRVTLDIPDSYALLFSLKSIEKELKLYAALMMLKKGKISVSKGAELADVSIYEFLNSCKEYEIPVIDYSKEELTEELESLKQEMP